MPGNNNPNPSYPFTLSTAAIPSTVGAAVIGVAIGASKAVEDSTNALQELNSKDSQTLLRSMDILFKVNDENKDKEIPGVNLSPDQLKDTNQATIIGVATSVDKILTSPVLLTSLIAQLPLDIKASIEGLINAGNYQALSKTEEASTLDANKELQEKKSGFFANSRALVDNFNAMRNEMSKQIHNRFPEQGSAGKSHDHFAQTMGSAVLAGGMTTAGLFATVFDVIGSAMREVSGLTHFSQQETENRQEKNIYAALDKCSDSLSESKDCAQSLAALRDLEAAVSNFKQASEIGGNHVISGPTLSVLTRLLISAPFVESLISVNCSALALSEAQNAMGREKQNFTAHTQNSAARASLIKDVSNGDAIHHSQNVSDFCKQFDVAIGHIDNDLQAIPNHGAIATSAASTVRSNSALVVATSLVVGLSGMVSREVSGTVDFFKNDKGTGAEFKQVLQSRKDMTGADLDALMTRVCAMQERLARCEELGVSAPVALGLSEVVTSGSLSASLNMMAGMIFALRELGTFSESPSHVLELNAAEKLKAEHSAQSVVDSNKKTGASSGTQIISDNLSLHNHLQSIMNKVVLIDRSYHNFTQPNDPRNNINSAGKSTIASAKFNSTGSIMGALGVLALIALESGIGTEALFGGLRLSTERQRLSDGVDAIRSQNGSKFNFSFLSNLTRLIANGLPGFSSATKTASQATYTAAETLASRSLTVALCHSGALKEILRRLTADNQQAEIAGYLDSALLSDALIPKLEQAILNVLNDAEKNFNQIPGLNRDMGSSLAGVSNSAIASALSAHSVFIAPMLRAIVAAKKASIIPDDIRNEALSQQSEAFNSISVALNMIQAFTNNSAMETQKLDGKMRNFSTHNSADNASNVAMFTSCIMSLVIEELLEITFSRSFTLLDRGKVNNTANVSTKNTKDESEVCKQGVAQDSGIGENDGTSRGLSALRLTISHLGVSLERLAMNIESHPDLLQDNLKIHTGQRAFLKSMASMCSSVGSSLMSLTAAVSVAPLTGVGSIDSLRDCLHSIDRCLILRPVHSSQECTQKDGSESSLLTGMATDTVTSLVTLATKLLLQGSVLGLDTTLSIAKIMEILSLNRRPDRALALETQALSQPNGSGASTNQQTKSTSVAGSIALAGTTLATRTDTSNSHSTDNSLAAREKAADELIEQIAMLEDAEENSSRDKQVIGLKKFYELMIRVLSGNGHQDESYEDLIKRLHRGGIALSHYHSEYGGITTTKSKKSNSLIRDQTYEGNDRIETLTEYFIRQATASEGNFNSVFNKFNRELANKTLSTKAQKSWNYLVERVMSRVEDRQLSHSIFHPKEDRRKKPDLRRRREELLNRELPDTQETVDERTPLNQTPGYDSATTTDNDDDNDDDDRATPTANV